MKKIYSILFGVAFVSIFAQNKTHKVEANENPTTIAKKYGISVDELLKQNPKIKNGRIDIGDILTLPNKAKSIAKKTDDKKEVSKKEDKKKETKSNKKLGKIELQPKQTIYGITKQYKISEDELRKLNPNLDKHMKVGEMIVLPEENIKKYGDVPVKDVVTESRKTENLVSSDENTYTVQPKDTYYGITKKFGISQKELFALNQGLEQKGLQPGEVIRVKGEQKFYVDTTSSLEQSKEIEKGEFNKSTPKTSNTAPKEEKTKDNKTKTYVVEDYLTHQVKKGDTAFSIVNKYGITYDQLAQLNDGLRDGISEGMELKIKKQERRYVKTDDDVISIALMLPFGFDSNDSKYRTLAADFLVGAKMAAQRNVKNGKKVSLNVIDAENESLFKNNLSQINKANTDIIIGPFFKSNVLEVLEYVKNEKIPVVAPFAHTEELYGYNNLVIVETGNRVYTEKIVKEVSAAHSKEKVYIIGEENNSEVIYLKEQLTKELSRAEIVVTNSVADIELDQNMATGQKLPAVLVLANSNNSVGTAFSKKIIELAKQTDGIKAFSMYYHSDFEKNIDGLSKANLVYLIDRKVNGDGDFEKEVLADFKKEYCRVPSKYTIIGFDVVNDMLARESNGEVLKNMGKVQTQLATKFEYVRMKRGGAFVNTGFRVIRLVP